MTLPGIVLVKLPVKLAPAVDFGGKTLLAWMREAHSTVAAGGHAKYDDVWYRMKNNGFPGREPQDAIRAFISSCDRCQKTTTTGAFRPNLQSVPIPDVPFSHITMDLKVFSRADSRGYRYILVVIDACTATVVLVPLKNKEAVTIVRALKDSVFGMAGFCTTWSSDNGGEFVNQEMDSLMQQAGATRVDLLPYEPQGNGKAERVMGMLNVRLEAMGAERRLIWSDHVWAMRLSINTALFTQTGESRALALFGFQPKSVVSRSSEVEEFRASLLGQHRKMQARQTEWYNVHHQTEDVKLLPGDLVLVQVFPHEKATSLDDEWKGPFVVKEQLSPVNVVLQDSSDPHNTFMRHVRRLKSFVPASAMEPLIPSVAVLDSEVASVAEVSTKFELPVDSNEAVVDSVYMDEGHDLLLPDVDFTTPIAVSDDRTSVIPLDVYTVSDQERRALDALRAYDSTQRELRGRMPSNLLTLEYTDVSKIQGIGGHRQNPVTRELEFLVTKWDAGTKHAGVWIKAVIGSTFVKSLQEYVVDVEF